jgi:hypothetical protein
MNDTHYMMLIIAQSLKILKINELINIYIFFIYRYVNYAIYTVISIDNKYEIQII